MSVKHLMAGGKAMEGFTGSIHEYRRAVIAGAEPKELDRLREQTKDYLDAFLDSLYLIHRGS